MSVIVLNPVRLRRLLFIYVFFFTLLPGLTDHKVNRVERYILVWSGKYKSLADVPALVRYVMSEFML